MADLDPISVDVPRGHWSAGQFPHLVMMACLVPGAWAVAGPALDGDAWLGLSERAWLWLAILVPIVQQVGVVLVWRSQLQWQLPTRVLGRGAFVAWGAFFFPLLIARPLSILGLGVADMGSLDVPAAVAVPIGALLFVPAAWTMHSVVKHFGFARALGGDHFFERYRAMPMVREGAFAWSSNAMYTFVFGAFWGLALVTQSRAALAAALFQHAAIWVHWYCTEQPDGVVLYGRAQDEG